MAEHRRVWEQPQKAWQPVATWTMLGVMGVVFLLEQVAWDPRIWLVWTDWPVRPWSPFTSTFAHDPSGFGHILINGLVLFFFGPILERFLGRRDFVVLFLVTGALSGIVQVELSAAFGDNRPALGASGAISFVMGTLTVLMPREKILIYGIVPVPFWAATAGFAAWDALGIFNPASDVGHFAHLGGLVVGLALGFGFRQNPQLRIGTARG